MWITDLLARRLAPRIPSPAEALPGRAAPAFPLPQTHFVNGRPLQPPDPVGHRVLVVGMGCFWGAERAFWSLPGVFSTAVGYAAGPTPHPTYEEVCSGRTGHNEVVRIVYDPGLISLDALLTVFWEKHDPTQGMRQGNDVGTQYRSGLYLPDEADQACAIASRDRYAAALARAGHAAITTELLPLPAFYFAEGYHQQYLAKNPGGYCGLGGTGVSCPVGLVSGG